MRKVRNLVVVYGDQLDPKAAAFDDFDVAQDVVWMAEADHEAKQVWSHKQRIALFLAAMRHFRDLLRERGYRVEYTTLDTKTPASTLPDCLRADIDSLRPVRVIVTRPGEWRVLKDLETACQAAGVSLELREDRHFYTTPQAFAEHAKGRKSLRMEFFYRELRKQFSILMEEDGKPVGGDWNYDKENRGTFGRSGPETAGTGPRHRPDATTREVLELVERRFGDHPGSLESFGWPVNRAEALRDLNAFVAERLPLFGRFEDAMWTDQPWLYHAWISAALNLKLLNPREVVDAAVACYEDGSAPLAAVEGFVRQILGWREYVRGIYWHYMPEYLTRNEMVATEPLPDFYWTGTTELNCLRQTIGNTLEHGYAHHIQRLMVTGLYALLLGVDPKAVHEWYLAIYVDAVEWVELPNVLGMSQYGDGGLMASKPYIATGKYIKKMSNYCKGCPKNPDNRTGPDACPFTTLYWDYLIRHEAKLRRNPRMSLQVRNLDRLDKPARQAIQDTAQIIRQCSAP